MTGLEQLTAYKTTGSSDNFAALVGHYANLVYATAYRRLSDRLLAEDATQTVFIRLAKRPPTPATDAELTAWLHRTTVHVSIDLWREESRRHAREQKAATMEPPVIDNNPLWEEMAPQLDEALNELSDSDRQALLLRFFERRPMIDIGRVFGVSEDAAKMRVSRALDRLRAQLIPRGVNCSAAALWAILDQRSTDAAPAGLLLKLQQGMVGGGLVPSAGSGFFQPTPAIKIASGIGAVALVLGLVVFSKSPPPPGRAPALPGAETNGAAVSLARMASTPRPATSLPPETPSPNPSAPVPRLLFHAVDAETGQTLGAAQLRAAYFYAGGRGERHLLTTDFNGEAEIPPANEGGEPGMNLFVSREGYVPKAISFRPNFAREYVLRMDPAAAAGGIVVTENGEPAVGIKIRANRSEKYTDDQPNTDFQITAATTDEHGRWIYNFIPKTYKEVRLTLEGKGYAVTDVMVRMGTPESIQTRLVIKSGFVVAGQVTDTNGNPLVAAKVSEFHNYDHRKLSTETGVDGRFQLIGVSTPASLGNTVEIAAEAEGKAPQLRTLELAAHTNWIQFTLSQGNIFGGRIVDPEGRPIVGAVAETDTDRSGRRPFFWFTHTDAGGRFTWNSAPAEPTLFWFEADGFETIRDRVLRTDATNHEIVLKPSR
jgi:RNA polymerase sigma factor (sigma-70 family)